MIIDLHCDTIKKAYDKKINLQSNKLQFNISKVKKILPYIQVLATFIGEKEAKNGLEVALNVIENFYNNLYNTDEMYLIKNKDDLTSKELEKKLGIILSIENGSAISSNLENIDLLYEKGIRIMSVVWNEDNELASGALTTDDKGLTKFGKKFIKKLVEKNILIDVSHASEKTFWDIVEIVGKVPIIATHSCVKGIKKHKRNLTDNQIRQIAKNKGTIGITYVNDFLKEDGKASSKEIVDHIDYIVNLVGISYVSLGGDFDGISEEQMPNDVRDVNDVINIINELIKRGYTKNEIDKITSENFINVINKFL